MTKRRTQPLSARNLAMLAVGSFLAATVAMASAPAAQAQAVEPSPHITLSQGFSDVKGNEAFAEAAYALVREGIMQARPDGSFAPNEPVTRAEIAVSLAQALSLPGVPGQPFLDVNETDWLANAVASLHQQGLVGGTSPWLFSPDRRVSREQAATLVMRSLGFFQDHDPGPHVRLILKPDQAAPWLGGFRDRSLISPSDALWVANAYRMGVIEAPADGWYFPSSDVTRAQMAQMLYRAFLKPVEARWSYPQEVEAVSTYEPLSVGAKGRLVHFLETRLTALGYLCGPVDGVYDRRTKDAVMAFQKVERMKRDGSAGPKVWERLLTAETPRPRESLEGTRAEVDLTRQVLFMITDDQVWKVVHVSTGKLGTRTGHFTIGSKYEGWIKCVTLDGEMYYPSYIVSKTAIHGYRSVPAYPASHGCVRVPVWTAVDLYKELPQGTVVDVYY